MLSFVCTVQTQLMHNIQFDFEFPWNQLKHFCVRVTKLIFTTRTRRGNCKYLKTIVLLDRERLEQNKNSIKIRCTVWKKVKNYIISKKRDIFLYEDDFLLWVILAVLDFVVFELIGCLRLKSIFLGWMPLNRTEESLFEI